MYPEGHFSSNLIPTLNSLPFLLFSHHITTYFPSQSTIRQAASQLLCPSYTFKGMLVDFYHFPHLQLVPCTALQIPGYRQARLQGRHRQETTAAVLTSQPLTLPSAGHPFSCTPSTGARSSPRTARLGAGSSFTHNCHRKNRPRRAARACLSTSRTAAAEQHLGGNSLLLPAPTPANRPQQQPAPSPGPSSLLQA